MQTSTGTSEIMCNLGLLFSVEDFEVPTNIAGDTVYVCCGRYLCKGWIC